MSMRLAVEPLAHGQGQEVVSYYQDGRCPVLFVRGRGSKSIVLDNLPLPCRFWNAEFNGNESDPTKNHVIQFSLHRESGTLLHMACNCHTGCEWQAGVGCGIVVKDSPLTLKVEQTGDSEWSVVIPFSEGLA
jgi:hypothetical protein